MASVPFNNLITFSRGTNATLTGPNGLIQYAPNNLLTFSEQFDNASWTKNATTVLANSTVAPDGTSTADTVTPSTANSAHNIYASFTYTATTYTLSVYVKPNGYSWVKLGSMFTGQGVFFDVSNGVVGTANAGYTGTIIAAGNGWYRCSVTQTAAAGADLPGLYVASSGSVVSFAGNGTSGIFLWGAQLELGSTATTYNPTTVKNLLGFSEAFDNAAWNKANASIVTGAQANPVNGAFNAQKLMENATGSTDHTAYTNAITAIVGTTYVISFYVKAAGRNWAAVGNFDSSWRRAYFDLVNGVVGTVDAGITAQIVSVGSGWYRCSVTRVMASTSIYAGVWTASANGVVSYTGDGNSGVYIYGAQLSDSASLDPYVPTPGAAPSSTAYYGPRFDYDPVTLAPKGILVEEARTNIFTYSEQFDNAAWTKSGATVTANATTSPDGTVNADTLIENTSNAFHAAVQSFTLSGATTISCYLKANTRSFAAIRTYDATNGDRYVVFNLATGAAGATSGGTTSTITSVGNGWYRCSMTYTYTSASGSAGITVQNANSYVAYTGDGTSGIYVWGAQLEAGAFATSYIPTIASTVTRSADVATITGSLFSQWYGPSEGTLLTNFVPTNSIANNTRAATITDGTNRVVDIYIDVNVWRSFNGTTNVTPASSTAVLNSAVNFASAYKSGDYAASMNGSAVGTAATAGVQSSNKLTLGANITSSAGFLNGHIRSIQYYPVRAADFQLQALTT